MLCNVPLGIALAEMETLKEYNITYDFLIKQHCLPACSFLSCWQLPVNRFVLYHSEVNKCKTRVPAWKFWLKVWISSWIHSWERSLVNLLDRHDWICLVLTVSPHGFDLHWRFTACIIWQIIQARLKHAFYLANAVGPLEWDEQWWSREWCEVAAWFIF
jgi:hypothetical protein